MRKLIIFCIFMIITVSLSAEDKDTAVLYTHGAIYGTGSVSYIPQTDYNLSLGFEALFINMDNINIPPPIYVGIDYKWNFANDGNSNILKWNFRFVLFEDIYSGIFYGILWLPIGLNMAYNFNQNNFSIGPGISCQINIFLDLFLSLDYSYNFIINDYKNNYHQIAFKFGIYIFGFEMKNKR